MGRHLVQKDERGGAFELLDQLGLGENEPDQKRLLLARGAVRRRAHFWGRESLLGRSDAVLQGRALPARSRSRPSSRTGAEFILDLGRRPPRQRLFEPSFERDAPPTGRGLRRAPRASARSASLGRATASRRAAAMAVPASAICSSSPSNRARRALAHLEQAVPLPHGAVVAAKRRAHLGIDGEHQPVEETPPLRCRRR